MVKLVGKLSYQKLALEAICAVLENHTTNAKIIAQLNNAAVTDKKVYTLLWVTILQKFQSNANMMNLYSNRLYSGTFYGFYGSYVAVLCLFKYRKNVSEELLISFGKWPYFKKLVVPTLANISKLAILRCNVNRNLKALLPQELYESLTIMPRCALRIFTDILEDNTLRNEFIASPSIKILTKYLLNWITIDSLRVSSEKVIKLLQDNPKDTLPTTFLLHVNSLLIENSYKLKESETTFNRKFLELESKYEELSSKYEKISSQMEELKEMFVSKMINSK